MAARSTVDASGQIEFLLGDELRSLDAVDANAMLLDYLRENERRPGTKEGCRAGDCGACTVVLGEPRDGRLEYRAVNSCITNLASVHGCQVLTVEDVGEGNDLHPVQNALVDCHGSQCGFCTPGMVMSLFAMSNASAEEPKSEVRDELAGNLCRCTGYRPIAEAARRTLSLDGGKATAASSGKIADRLQGLRGHNIAVRGPENAFYSPTELATTIDLLAEHGDAVILAGGTDLALEITQRLKRFETVIHVGRVRELVEISETDEELILGAAVTYRDLAGPLLELYPECSELLRRFGSAQIRNRGTIGGNLANASPIGDMLPILLALDAQVSTASANGLRRIPVSSFFTGYRETALDDGELIVSVHVPRPHDSWCFRAYKVTKRPHDDIASVSVAINAELISGVVGDIRIAYGGMAAVPKRATAAEESLRGNSLDRDRVGLAQTALESDFAPISDVRASAEYRIGVAKGLLERFRHEVMDVSYATQTSMLVNGVFDIEDSV